MDKPIEEWLRRFRGMGPEKIVSAWSAKANEDLSWQEEANFHAAAAERMKQLGNMAVDLDEDTRISLCRQAMTILNRLQRCHADNPETLDLIEESVSRSTDYYQKFGTRTARYYMFEQGMIDELGDRKKLG